MKHDYAFVVCISPCLVSNFLLMIVLKDLAVLLFRELAFLFFCLCLPHNFFLQEFSDPRDADDARYGLNGRRFDGTHIVVEFAKGVSCNYMDLPLCC